METRNEQPRRRKSRWGKYFILALLGALICLAVLIYIGWFDNKTHVDSPNGDNVMDTYRVEMPDADAPGVNDWQNPDHDDLRDVIVNHADGTDTGGD